MHLVCIVINSSSQLLQGGYTGYDQSYGSYNTSTDQQGGVPAAVANAAQSLPAESQQKLANIVAKVHHFLQCSALHYPCNL